MKKIIVWTLWLLLATSFTSLYAIKADASEMQPPASGKIVGGYRILPIQAAQQKVRLTAYRGDYIKFAFDDSIKNPVLSIPLLSIQESLPRDFQKAPFFKLKKTGVYAFSLGRVSGEIRVVEFRRQHYREITAREAATLLENRSTLVLDVRTPAEFKQGHLKAAVLIPVQELQLRVKELSAHKNGDILLYCATGNRSTVASKILSDLGFKHLYNLRHGIVDWLREKHPVVR